jgi:hypothetical protein
VTHKIGRLTWQVLIVPDDTCKYGLDAFFDDVLRNARTAMLEQPRCVTAIGAFALRDDHVKFSQCNCVNDLGYCTRCPPHQSCNRAHLSQVEHASAIFNRRPVSRYSQISRAYRSEPCLQR